MRYLLFYANFEDLHAIFKENPYPHEHEWILSRQALSALYELFLELLIDDFWMWDVFLCMKPASTNKVFITIICCWCSLKGNNIGPFFLSFSDVDLLAKI